jgi:hypothetical protein
MKALRSILAVLVPYVIVFIVVMLTDVVLNRIFPTVYVEGKVPPVGLLWVSTGIYAVASLFAGWLCVRLAPARAGLHLLILFLLGEAFGGYTTVLAWDKQPHWVSIVWLIIWPVALWIGGRRTAS